MLEDQVAFLLQRYLGNYVRGLNKEALKISVWNGDVELTNMQLKPEALNALKLPVKVKAGFLGSVKLKAWARSSGSLPGSNFLLAEPATQVEGHSQDAVQEAKRNLIREMEMKLLERAQQSKLEVNKSWVGSLINTIIGNLKLSISNIHIRYEDLESNPGHPFAAGVTLQKLSAVTVDDSGTETFVTGGSLDHIQKSVELDQLALYLDSDISPWHLNKPWEDLLPLEWSQVFRFGTENGRPAAYVVKKHSYLLQPVTGNAKYSKFRPDELSNSDQPLQKASVNLDDVTLSLSKDGYRDMLKLVDNFAAFNQRLKYAHYRPLVSVKSNPRAWWIYAFKAISDQTKKASGKLSWEQVLRYASLRKRYIPLYASLLKSDLSQAIPDDNKEIEEMDRELDVELIVQWRMLAHKFVEQSVESDLYARRQKSKKSWWSFGWNDKTSKDGSESEQFNFSNEDWEQLHRLIGYTEGADEQSMTINENAETLHTYLEVHMKHNASKLVDGQQELLAELSCDGFDCYIKLYPESKIFDMKLGSYQLSSPSGLLAESATVHDSLIGVFSYKPFDAKVDWRMIAKASPCYMTYLKDSVDDIIKFFQNNDALSQTVALETAAAVQMTIDEVKRTAQKQVNRALKDHARFILDLDIAAPKITIPTSFCPDNVNSTKLMLDLGNLLIRSQDDYDRKSFEELDMYLQFDLILSDVTAFLIDGDYHWSQSSLNRSANSTLLDGVSFLPVVDKCGVIVRLQQIRVENPSYPSTRIAVRLPSLGFHFSPARYHRLMQVAKLFQEDNKDNLDLLHPWNQADFEGWLSVLTRKGMGNREAFWQRRYICLVGPYLYILESPGSKSYKQYLSLREKQIYLLPPEFVGDVECVLAVCDAARPMQKVVEDVSALILRCDSNDSRRNWQSRLQGAIYRASGSTIITSLSETSSESEDPEAELDSNLKSQDSLTIEHVFMTGALDELRICFNYNPKGDQRFAKVLLAEESRLFEFRAIGGQVELSMRANDMFVGTVLKSLEIEDLVCRRSISRPCFLARSFIQGRDTYSSFDHVGKESLGDGDSTPSEGDDKFYEAPENLVDFDNLSSQKSLSFESSWYKLPSFSRIAGLLPGVTAHPRMEYNLTQELESFVKAQIVIYDQSSSLYNNVDMQVTITLATLSFFCRRPTIFAIMDFINAVIVEEENDEYPTSDSVPPIENDITSEDIVDEQYLTTKDEPVAKGLLGKENPEFSFSLSLQRDFSVLTKFFSSDKVFPSSFSIKASLGNLKISDDSLSSSHSYFWICDMRNPGGKSFVELVFSSFNVDDEDYEGYEYSLFGQLSEVRLVYLNRFVQEVVSYFTSLVPENSKSVVKLQDQVTNSEKWFTTSEIEGSPAFKLDLSLTKPIILMPRRTDSPDYLKLDVVHITVRNTFQWLQGSKSDMGAVHLEILTIQVEDINLNVGTGTELGESIIQDVKGISIVIQRSLRDLLRQVPNTEATIKIEELKAALSNSEYQIITECALSNISETPRLMPPLNHDSVTSNGGAVESIDPQHPVGIESESQSVDAWISLKISVVVNLVQLCLHPGLTKDASLATIQVSGAWLLYKSNNHGDGFLSATLKGFTLIDDRVGIDEEYRLAIRRPEAIGCSPSYASNDDETHEGRKIIKESESGPVPAMLILDAKFLQHSTVICLCVQRPQLLVALDFLLAVVEFFVPTVGNLLSDEESNKSSYEFDAVVLDESVYIQTSAEFSLSPLRYLIADSERFDYYIYDGNGGILHLKDRQGFGLSAPSKEAIIYVGSGKRLQFRNVVIKNGQYLDSCVLLGSNSGYSASRDDNVILEGDYETNNRDFPRNSALRLPSHPAATDRSAELIFELQAIGPELTFYSTSKDVGVSPILSNKLLHAQLDAFSRLVLKGDTMEMTANALGLMMESNGIRILEPFDTSVKYSNASGKTNIHLSVSDIYVNFTFSILRLFIAVEEDILAFLRMTSKKMTITCSQFDKVGTIKNMYNDQVYAFWRPRAPPGFAVLGDCLTPLDKPPTRGVLAVNSNLARVRRPKSFKLIWPPSSSEKSSDNEAESYCSVWFPEPPGGYVALGCVVSPGKTQPSPSSTFCILASLVSPSALRDCITIASNDLHSWWWAFRRVDNSVGTFLPSDHLTLSLTAKAYELRHVKFRFQESPPALSRDIDVGSPSSHVDAVQSERSTTISSGRRFEAVASFQLIWWNRSSNSRKKISIWRPVVPQGMVFLGDIAVRGYEPPNTCVVLHDTRDEELFRPPLDYQLVGQIKRQRGMENISFWMPQAPPGFVSLGCVACKGSPKQYDFSRLRCLRTDMVVGDQFLEESVWDTTDAKFTSESFSIWTVGNELGTFIVRSGCKRPPRRFALKLADPNVPSGADDTVVDAEIRTFSAAVFDDYGGLMVPLFNLSLAGLGFSLHGRADYLNSTYDTWEPLIEPVDGFLRYQYDLNAPGAASQLRLTSTRDLNINVSVSNTNMVLQSYASWNNLSHTQDYGKNREEFSLTRGPKSIIDVHHKKHYYIVPQNKLGWDIFIRTTESRGLAHVIKMPAGDAKLVKVPVSKNMLDSHIKGELCTKVRTLVTVVVVDAQLPTVGGLTSNLYTVAIRLTADQGVGGNPLPHQQSARTSGAISNSSSSEFRLVNWNETFFFKVDSQINYLLELVVTDMGKGDPIGFFSAPLTEIAQNLDSCDYQNHLKWIDLSPAVSEITVHGDKHEKPSLRLRCLVILSSRPEDEGRNEFHRGTKKSGFIQISPSVTGPWTTVKLNYSASAACWRLGNDVVASEVSVKDGNRYVNIRSLVSVQNHTGFVLDLCLVSKASNLDIKSLDYANQPEALQINGGKLHMDEFFETETYNPTAGWVGCSSYPGRGYNQDIYEAELPSGWEWVDDWHVDTSSVSTADGWVYSPDVESLKWPESYDPLKFVNYARQRRWIRSRKQHAGNAEQEISLGKLKPGDTVPLPLSCLAQSEMYVLKLRPFDINSPEEYSWSTIVDRPGQMEGQGLSGICVSSLTESEELLYCTQITGSSSNGCPKFWFCISIQASEIAKDIHLNPIQDWHLVVKSPLSISNYLPLTAEYSILEMQESGHFVACHRGIFNPGESMEIHNADIRKPLFLSLLPQKGWLPIHEAVLISQPFGIPSKTMSLRSSISGRIVQLIIEQNCDKDQPHLAKIIRVYAPFWFSIAKCPPLTFKLVNLVGNKSSQKIALPFRSRKSSEVTFGEITEEEIYEGHTIASALNFNLLGLAVSINQSGMEQRFGPIKDLSPLGDMDGSLDLYAYDGDDNCLRLLCLQSHVICIRPFMTFTNRIGQNLYIKFNNSRISFVYRQMGSTDKLQVRLEDTDWSYPVSITKEDTIFLVLRQNGKQKLLRTEIRGFEEGSRFIVVFRLGPPDGPIRIENRTTDKTISIRQSGFGEEAWIKLDPLSTTNFSWEDPYGHKVIDAKTESNSRVGFWKLDLEKIGGSFSEEDEVGLQFHVMDLRDIKVARFMNYWSPTSNEETKYLIPAQNLQNSQISREMKSNTTSMELIVDLAVVGISVVDHRPKELSYLYFERVFLSYSTGYDGGTTSRLKIILGHLQLDNQLPLTLMPVLLTPDQIKDMNHPVFKMTITMRNENTDGIQVYPYIYIRVTDKVWRLNIHEPIVWAVVDFYNNLQLARLSQGSSVTQVDPEIHIELIDVSEIRLKLSLETAPAQRPHEVLGLWKIDSCGKVLLFLPLQIEFGDLIHNPLHLIFSVDVLGMTSSTLASLSKGFAELSTDGQFLQLRSKQVGSRRITGVGDGLIQGTEALAQGVAFGVSGVVTKPVESARQNGLLGLAHGLVRAFLGIIAQPVSGALDFFSLTVGGIGASCSKCLEILNNNTTSQRIRNPRVIHADGILREYCEREAVGQMMLYLAEASRHFGCTEIFKEPSKFAWSDYYEDHFVVPYQRVVLVTNKRVMLLQCPTMDKLDRKPSKIMWDVQWDELMSLELAKGSFQQPSHLLLHLKNFRRSEAFVRVIKCNVEEESEDREPQAVKICSVVCRMWKAHQYDTRCLVLKVPSSQRRVYFAWSEADGIDKQTLNKTIISSRKLFSLGSTSDEQRFVKHSVNFSKVWSSEQESKGRCKLCRKQVLEDGGLCTIWRPICPDGYVSIGDVAHVGDHPPNVAAVYRNFHGLFALPMGYDLIWRNCVDDYKAPVSIWHPRAPDGYVAPGCVAVAGFMEPELDLVHCVAESVVEETEFENQKIWSAPDSYPWACHIYQVKSDALHFVALRQKKEESAWKPTRILDDHHHHPEA
ncbi:hypothetical protein K2173_003749 [Erythroxylum novogranatense]|uniref:PH domain-containing protein n=1 Tax=Erythroxylum novogranatense TaxID=1862640 RepID=A0AAV8TB87_9ROSI|nr:hypothetical protein K2173_003749 [Erythroxylum novogranatense]